MSNVFNYQSKLEAFFEMALIKLGKSTKTRINYKSDLKHFLHWISELFSKLEIQPKNITDFLSHIQPETISDYVSWQQKINSPVATINRRLSSIRMFFHVAYSAHLIKSDPAKSIGNINPRHPPETNPLTIVGEFKIALIREGAARSTVRNYSNDVENFINWITNTTQIK